MSRGQVLVVVLLVLLGVAVLAVLGWVALGVDPPDAEGRNAPANSSPSIPQTTATAIPNVTPTLATGADVTGESLAGTATEPAATREGLPTGEVIPDPLACLPAGEGEGAEVREVRADGSLRASIGRRAVEVTLLGVETAGEDGFALGVLRQLVEGQRVQLLREAVDVDSGGRLLRYVIAGGVFVNYELVRRGAGLPALYPPGQACAETMLAAERLARAEGLGYWSLIGGGLVGGLVTTTPGALPCDCSVEYQCLDFTLRSDAQACYDACGDYRNVTLDEDNDGLACEDMP